MMTAEQGPCHRVYSVNRSRARRWRETYFGLMLMLQVPDDFRHSMPLFNFYYSLLNNYQIGAGFSSLSIKIITLYRAVRASMLRPD